MSSNRVARRLQDIIDNAQAIGAYIRGMTSADFAEKPDGLRRNRAVYGTDLRGSGQVGRYGAVSDAGPAMAQNSCVWECTAARIRHIEYDRLFEVVTKDLPALSAACTAALQKIIES